MEKRMKFEPLAKMIVDADKAADAMQAEGESLDPPTETAMILLVPTNEPERAFAVPRAYFNRVTEEDLKKREEAEAEAAASKEAPKEATKEDEEKKKKKEEEDKKKEETDEQRKARMQKLQRMQMCDTVTTTLENDPESKEIQLAINSVDLGVLVDYMHIHQGKVPMKPILRPLRSKDLAKCVNADPRDALLMEREDVYGTEHLTALMVAANYMGMISLLEVLGCKIGTRLKGVKVEEEAMRKALFSHGIPHPERERLKKLQLQQQQPQPQAMVPFHASLASVSSSASMST